MTKPNLINSQSKEKLSRKKRFRFFNAIKKDLLLYLMLALPIGYYLVFKYWPMYGIVIAFQDYNIFSGFFNSQWVGLDVFREIFRMKDFWNALRNTLMLSILELIIGFPGPIILAILLNELKNGIFKKSVQSLLYLPHFMSWVIISGILYQLLSVQYGFINKFIGMIGLNTIPFLTDPKWWVVTYLFSGIWQNIGWGAIIYLAAISGINAELFEAAIVDGCTKIKLIWYVTLPSIMPTIVIMLILSVGNILGVGFERVFSLSNSLVTQYSDVLSTFVYRTGIQNARFSVATAVGLFQSVVAFFLIITTNSISKKLGQDGIW